MIFYLGLIYAHYVADFFCQTDSMARNKSTSNMWLLYHVLVYALVMLVPCSILFYAHGITIGGGLLGVYNVVSFSMVAYWLLLNGFLHFVTDYYTSRWSKPYFVANDFHNGFNVVGFDQCIHYTCLFVTARMVIG